MPTTMALSPTTTRVILYNKPTGVVVTNHDELGRETVADRLRGSGCAGIEAFEPCGRLDMNTSGLLLLTNDGLLIHHVTNKNALVVQSEYPGRYPGGNPGGGEVSEVGDMDETGGTGGCASVTSASVPKEYRAKCMGELTEEAVQHLRKSMDANRRRQTHHERE